MTEQATHTGRTERFLFIAASLAGAVCIVFTLAAAAGWLGGPT